jgi:DNA-directed RNA polymerase beta' subunit
MHTKHPIKLGTSKFVDTRDKKAISSFVVMAMTGSKGSVTQGKQMIIAKALVTKQDNSIVPFPIFNSMSKGLSTMEYFLSTSGSREWCVLCVI